MPKPPTLAQIIGDSWFEFYHPGASDAANRKTYRQRKVNEDWLEIQEFKSDRWIIIKYLSLIMPDGKRVQDEKTKS